MNTEQIKAMALEIADAMPHTPMYFKPGYCPHCQNTGYIGKEREPCSYCNARDDGALADRIEGMAGLGILSHLDDSGQLDINGQLTAEEKAQIVAALRRS